MFPIPGPVMTVLNILNQNGFRAYVVGGCVRDTLMGKEPHDWDVTTDAKPDAIKELFADFRTVDIGIKHGTVMVLSSGMPIEITTFRVDGAYSDNRHPDKVAFTDRLEDDLSRRDFTVNAMAYHPEEGLIDPFGGEDDLKSKTIRCVGNPDTRFREDALRILRALRFASTLNFSIEPETAQSILQNANLLNHIAKERISTELVKMLCGDNIFEILMRFRSVFAVFMPELALEFDFAQHGRKHAYDVWEHTAHTVDNIEADPILRLTMLLHDAGKPATHKLDADGNSTFKNHAAVGGVIAENILKRLRFKNDIIKTVSFLVSVHDKDVPATRVQVKEYIRDLGEENFIRLMKIRRADKSALSKDFRDISEKLIFAYSEFDDVLNKNEPCTLAQLAVKGNDLKPYVPENEIGNALNDLLEIVIRDPEKNKKQTLLAMFRQS